MYYPFRVKFAKYFKLTKFRSNQKKFREYVDLLTEMKR